jgi:hypothetical protein
MLNTESMQRLGEFLKQIQRCHIDGTAWPKAGLHELDFYVLKPEQLMLGEEAEAQESNTNVEPKRVTLRFRTTGGDCRRIVGSSFAYFFYQCGLHSTFFWDDEFWAVPHFKDLPSPLQMRVRQENRGTMPSQ